MKKFEIKIYSGVVLMNCFLLLSLFNGDALTQEYFAVACISISALAYNKLSGKASFNPKFVRAVRTKNKTVSPKKLQVNLPKMSANYVN